MLNAQSLGTSARLAAPMTAGQLTMRLAAGAGQAIDPGAGNHVWVTLREGVRFERVKVVGRVGDLLTLEARGADNSTAQAWPTGACVIVEWNPAQLCEFVQNCMDGAAEPTGVEPQTICTASCACFDVGADGRITRISGGQSC